LLSGSPLVSLAAYPLLAAQASGGAPSGYSPVAIRHAYGFDQVSFSTSSGTVAANGAGQTIAIVDAYNDPNIGSDLQVFDQQFGLAAPAALTVVNQNGGSRLPATDAGWSMEITLDVEWAHAIAPGAKILLVEANSSNLGDLLAAVNYARQQSGVTTVSMSWGGGDFYGEANYDNYFTTPTGHVGVSFVAASGDNGGSPMWPAVSPSVLGVGGTTLGLSAANARSSETAWSGSSGGTSRYESEPTYQRSVQSTGHRDAPDVAYDANPNSGFSVYDSVSYAGYSGWFNVGGTSAGAPQWAALVAIADQGRATVGLASLQSLPASLYALPSSDFYDVTSGSNIGYKAAAGYDLVTGLGAPNANLIINHLVYGVSSSASAASPAAATSSSSASSASATSGGTTFGRHGISRAFGPDFAFDQFLAAPTTDDGSIAASLPVPVLPAVVLPRGPASAELAVQVYQSGGLVPLSPAGQDFQDRDSLSPAARQESSDAYFRDLVDPPLALPSPPLGE
jgi:subtilase family serine protease